MRTRELIFRSLAFYWRTNLTVVFGVAVAVSVLTGALLVGDSVRESLRRLFLERIGRTDLVVASQTFFTEDLANRVLSHKDFASEGFESVAPLIALDGAVTHEESGRVAGAVHVYGVDERFLRFHRIDAAAQRPPFDDEILLSPSLGEELRAAEGDTLLLRVRKPSDIPVESLHGRKDDVGRTIRLRSRGALPSSSLGEFSLRPQQGAVRAVFVSLSSLGKLLGREGRVNTLLLSVRDRFAEDERVAGAAERLRGLLREHLRLVDAGAKLRVLDERRGIALESDSGLLSDALAANAREAAAQAGARATPVLSYLANSIRANGREVPYSIVTAIDEPEFRGLLAGASSFKVDEESGAATDVIDSQRAASRASNAGDGEDEESAARIVLNEWTARDLSARVGDRVTLEYFLWDESGRLLTREASFRLAGVVPMTGLAADADLVPEYPGITETESLSDWDPPFPIDLKRIRPRDESYWDSYRATPKGFITLESGRALWRSRFGELTSFRFESVAGASPEAFLELYERSLGRALEPAALGMTISPVRAEGLRASRGATDFGQYFLYFSFFVLASALLLTALFFRLGVEQRVREIGLLRTIGYPPERIRTIYLIEGVLLSFAGGLLGALGGYAYGWLIMHGLRTWWVDAVNTTSLELHAQPVSFALGLGGGLLAASVCIAFTLRGLRRASVRELLVGDVLSPSKRGGENALDYARGEGRGAFVRFARGRFRGELVGAFALAGGVLSSVGAALDIVGETAGFFASGTLVLVALLCFQSVWLRRRLTGSIEGSGWTSLSRLGARNATHRPGRSILSITLIAFAVFIIVAVDSFRRDDASAAAVLMRGTGGYPLLAESLLPIVHDPGAREGREALNLSTSTGDETLLSDVRFQRFRLRPGEDASCLNLYQPQQPRILAPTSDFLRQRRFAFQDGPASFEAENPWLLLERSFEDGAIPVIADANSLQYVLHLKVGDDFTLDRGGEGPVLLRVVAALSDSVFQSELLMSEENFLRLFPRQEGYRFFLIETESKGDAPSVAAHLEERLADYGFDVEPASERLSNFHRVENTYLSTFQTLGGLGLVLGTLGLAAILLRNVLERRRELALLRAVGYRRSHFALIVLAENALLLSAGLLTGTLCALLAVAPAVAERGGRLPYASLAVLLLAVIISGLGSSLLATIAAFRSSLLSSLRSE